MSVQALKLPQPDDLSDDEKDTSMGAYLMMFATWIVGLPLPFLGLVASFIYYVINRKNSQFIGFHSYQALLLHIPVSIYNGSAVIWGILVAADVFGVKMFLLICIPVFLLANIIYIVMSIVGAVYAKKGRFLYLPVFGRMAFSKYYVDLNSGQKIIVNSPPKGI
jgi:uncharacterized membrane protein